MNGEPTPAAPAAEAKGEKGHLIPVRKTVTREGATFDQTFWVRSGDAAPKVRALMRDAKKRPLIAGRTEREFAALVSEFGGEGKLAAAITRDWATSPNSARAISARAAAVALVSDNPAEQEAMAQEDLDDLLRVRATYEKSASTPETIKAAHQEGRERVKSYASALSSVAALSQSMYEEEEVTVYRGIGGAQAQALKDAAAKGASLDVDVGVITSFTDSAKVAKKFAGKGGVVLTQRVPRKSILFSHRAVPHFMTYGEREVSVLSKGMLTVTPNDIEAT